MPSILKGDEIRLRQVAVNILTNAVKYTEEGSVTLRLTYKKIGETRIALTTAVKDTGIGIKEDDIEKLYHAFERIEEERNRTIEGTGLGMNITKKLLEMMGSHLEVASVYGEGSEFSYTVEQDVLNWSPMGNYEEAYSRMMAAQTAYKESYRCHRTIRKSPPAGGCRQQRLCGGNQGQYDAAFGTISQFRCQLVADYSGGGYGGKIPHHPGGTGRSLGSDGRDCRKL
jgi:hypothetical protein